MKTAVIFGGTGGIGHAISDGIQNLVEVINVPRQQIDLANPNSHEAIQDLLQNQRPDIIINSAGILGTDHGPHNNVMQINFGSNWSIIQYHMQRYHAETKIIMIGSSSYRGGHRDYMLYSASKAALYNLWLSSRDFFQNTKVSVDLINPVRTRTRMSSELDLSRCIEPQDVAQAVTARLFTTDSVCIDMSYKESK